ncbi:MAG: hypothetical protein Q7J86_12200 [Bacteroidota bacterium]|nr:hypothetical protein [Bacteroidota bacterium]
MTNSQKNTNIGNAPKRKRLKKPERLNVAKSWIKTYNGKRIISGYAKWFGVDKICAVNELKSIGVVIPEILEKQIINSHQLLLEQKNEKREKRNSEDAAVFLLDSDENFTFIVGYTSNGFPFGSTREEFNQEI